MKGNVSKNRAGKDGAPGPKGEKGDKGDGITTSFLTMFQATPSPTNRRRTTTWRAQATP